MPVFRWTSRLSPRARTRTLVSATLITAASLGAATLASVAGPAQPAAASVSCPWVGSSAPISQRVSQLLARMTVAQKVTVLTGASGSSYVGYTPRPSGRCASRP
jgi:beta-glucosidase